jgi:hypothetical protein
MPLETTNIMTLTTKPGQELEMDPPQLRVLADKKEIVLKANEANQDDIRVDFVQDPGTVFVRAMLPEKLVLQKGEEIRLRIRQDLPLAKRGTFTSHHDIPFARGIDLDFPDFNRTAQGDHTDIHIEC